MEMMELFSFVLGLRVLGKPISDSLCDQAVGKNVAVACIYSDFHTQKEQTPENILGALVKQIVRALGSIPSEIDEAFEKAKGQVGGRGPLIPELVKFLKTSLARLDRAYICIDAVNECLAKHPVFPTVPGALQGPGGLVVPGVPGGVGKDGRAWRPSFVKTAVLRVDARALQSYGKWHLPAVIHRARPSFAGPGRHSQGPAVICRARPSSAGFGRHL
ncbi:hypothetical protein L873DRAFT_1844242 [Choiromyces venosus 120613-1]|uniref:Nephrocystin 3-like N-terminal domain-containing protein n=1 Tax=Choiromyces venosus 120613-1 TaxID=1336337 RepID=A0A3N4JJA3_9PEZI|nr:hypothetical protein L873DRAFT_1844242 [Choiromyces venosus 120613-1]